MSSKYPDVNLTGDCDADAPALSTMEDVWMPVPDGTFSVRESGYSETKTKAPSLSPVYECVMGKMVGFTRKLTHLCDKLSCLREYLENNPERKFIVTSRILPGNGFYCHVVFVYCRVIPEGLAGAFEKLETDLWSGDDSYRNSRIKYLAQLPTAPFLVKTSVATLGGYRPVIMGNGYLSQKHCTGMNYLEVDVDIESSKIAKAISSTILRRSDVAVIDEGFVIEGREEDELPERLMCSSRFIHTKTDRVMTMMTEADLRIEGEETDWETSTTGGDSSGEEGSIS